MVEGASQRIQTEQYSVGTRIYLSRVGTGVGKKYEIRLRIR
jgi:hypothetical protein